MGRARNTRLKKAHTEHEFTPEELVEFALCAEDPVYFCKKYIRVQHPKRGAIPLELYPYQEKMMHMYIENRYTVVLSARQTGKSTISAIYLLWFAMFHEDKTILIASNKNKGAMEMIQRIRFAYEELPMFLKPGVSDDGWSKHTVAFDNGSRIESTATSENSGRGMSISLLFLDEFAFVKPNVQEEFWTSILPTLSTGGSCIMSSTPNGDSDLFAQLWRAADCGTKVDQDSLNFVPIHVRWDEPPGRDEAFKKTQIRLLGELKWRQEFECEMLSSDQLLIDTRVLFGMKQITEPVLEYNDFVFWQKLQSEQTYIVTVDPSTGSGLDYSVIDVYHFPSLNQVAQFRNNTMNSPMLYAKLKWMLGIMEQKMCTTYFTIENNGVGEGILALYQNDENPPEYAEMVSDGGTRDGMNTNKASKLKSCVSLKELFEGGKIQVNSPQTLKELKNFVRRKGSYEAQIGSTDDTVSCLLLLTRTLIEISTHEQAAFDKLYRYDEKDYFTGGSADNSSEDDPDPLPMVF